MPFPLPYPFNTLPSFYVNFSHKSNQLRAYVPDLNTLQVAREECGAIFTDLQNIYDISCRFIRRTYIIADKFLRTIVQPTYHSIAPAAQALGPTLQTLWKKDLFRSAVFVALLSGILCSAMFFLAFSFTIMYIFLILCINAIHLLVCILVIASVLATIFWCTITYLWVAYNTMAKEQYVFNFTV